MRSGMIVPLAPLFKATLLGVGMNRGWFGRPGFEDAVHLFMLRIVLGTARSPILQTDTELNPAGA